MEPGYHYHVINDKDGRIPSKQAQGYEFVYSEKPIGDFQVGEATALGSLVCKPVGNGRVGYLMRIKQEFYDEDQAAKAKIVDATEAALKPNRSKEEYGPGLTNG
jgi:hypothetical protein